MDPRKPRAPGGGGGTARVRAFSENPAAGRRDDVTGTTLGNVERWTGGVTKTIVVLVEAAAESKTTVEHERADERARPVPGTLERRCQCGNTLVESEGRVVSHPVMARRQASQDRRVGRQRHRHVRKRVCIADSAGGEPIERRRQAAAIPEGSHAISTQRIDRDEQQVGALRLTGCERRLRLTAATREGHRQQNRDARTPEGHR